MYKMLSVCLALSLSFVKAELITNNKSTIKVGEEVKKPKAYEDLINIEQPSAKSEKTNSVETYRKVKDLNIKRKKSNKIDKSGKSAKAIEQKKTRNIIRFWKYKKEKASKSFFV
jgi:hypothetical protein